MAEQRPTTRVGRTVRANGLSIVLSLLFVGFLVGQSVAGQKEFNEEGRLHGEPPLTYTEYLTSGDFAESVFENWESEFLQMGAYLLLTVYLVQKGSAESKPVDGDEDVERDPQQSSNPDAPWPVRRGGWILKLYQNSLSLAFGILFVASFALHAWGGARATCDDDRTHRQPDCPSTVEYVQTSKFWSESLENWQSEFLAVASIVVLSVYLRQQGSPESKPVNTPHHEHG